MITSLYGKYFQKSKTFLFPILGISKTAQFPPAGVYVSWKDKHSVQDKKLMLVYKKEDTPVFIDFEVSYLLSHPLFLSDENCRDGYGVYTFSLEGFEEDYNHFLAGHYSKLSSKLKKIIRTYYGETSAEYKYIDTYLYPDRYFDLYAKLLNVHPQLLESVGELCDKYDPKQEELKIIVEDLEVSKKAL
jgi:hypothetical protein